MAKRTLTFEASKFWHLALVTKDEKTALVAFYAKSEDDLDLALRRMHVHHDSVMLLASAHDCSVAFSERDINRSFINS